MFIIAVEVVFTPQFRSATMSDQLTGLGMMLWSFLRMVRREDIVIPAPGLRLISGDCRGGSGISITLSQQFSVYHFSFDGLGRL